MKLDRSLSNFRDLQEIRLKVKGVEAEALAHDPPLQRIEEGHVLVQVPGLESLGSGAVASEEPSLMPYIATGPFLMSDHAEIQAKSAEILSGVSGRVEAVERINQWVFENLRKVPTVGVPNALEVLRVGQGDCNEHTALFVGLARAAKIPSRVAAGVVYSDRVSEEAAFFYHAWPEVYFEEAGWVPLDPTFGQFPADATHIKVVDGGLDKQIAIMGVMGRLGFEWAVK